MNILVTGANGQLGKCLQTIAHSTQDHYIFTDLCEGYPRLDITDLTAVRRMVNDHQVECIVNCAAWTDVDGAETAGPVVEEINAIGPENLATSMQEVGGLVIHISTDYVFGPTDSATPFKEEHTCMPTSVYGQTKLHGEQLIKNTGANYLILRTSWLYSEYGKNFLLTMLRLFGERTQVHVVADQLGTPTYALDLARAIAKIVENRLYVDHEGTYHYSNEGECSWYDFAVEIARLSGNTTCEIVPCRTEDYPSVAKRPAYSVLDKTKIRETFRVDVPHWRHSLRECIKNIQR